MITGVDGVLVRVGADMDTIDIDVVIKFFAVGDTLIGAHASFAPVKSGESLPRNAGFFLTVAITFHVFFGEAFYVGAFELGDGFLGEVERKRGGI